MTNIKKTKLPVHNWMKVLLIIDTDVVSRLHLQLNVSLSCVYDNLLLLEQAGMIEKVKIKHKCNLQIKLTEKGEALKQKVQDFITFIY